MREPQGEPDWGYEIAKLIEQRSGGTLTFHVASMQNLLYRLEERGPIAVRTLAKRPTVPRPHPEP